MELWDIYDSCFEKTGRLQERGKDLHPGEYHLVVHIFPINSKKEILIQKRSDTVAWSPGVWAATGGSAIQGEDMYQACSRELEEELGIKESKDKMDMVAIFKKNYSFHSVWLVHTEAKLEELLIQKEEVAEARWVTRSELEDMINKDNFHKYHYMNWLLDYINNEV